MNFAALSTMDLPALRAFLGTPEGRAFRKTAGPTIAQLVSIDDLVPAVYEEWRRLVRDSMIFVYSRLSNERLATKLWEQAQLPLDAPAPVRLLQLISRMPGIQKMGQVLARNPNLEPSLRVALSQLENGLHDVEPATIHNLIKRQLGPLIAKHEVKIEPTIFSEASVSAVVRFTWRDPDSGTRQRGVFKVRKPHVARFFREDLSLLQQLSDHMAKDAGYGIGSRQIGETVAEVRLLLEHELDFPREQATLIEAYRTHRFTSGLRVPAPISQLCTPVITAMSEERGIKVTEAFRHDIVRRRRIAEQLIEALIAVPLLSREENVLFHADPHAGNLLYDERRRELVLLDWALTGKLSRDSRRHLTLLVLSTILRDTTGIAEQTQALSLNAVDDTEKAQLIRDRVEQFMNELTEPPGALDAMRLLDRVALEGIKFPASLALFRKVLFTLDGVLYDILGQEIRMDSGIVREFLVRLISSYGFYHSPLDFKDFFCLERSALLYPVRRVMKAVPWLGATR